MHLILVFGTAFCFATNALLMKLAGGKIDPLSGVFFWALGALVAGVSFFAWQKTVSQSFILTQGAVFVFAAGFLMALGTAAYITAFYRGADFSFVTPIVNITVVMTGITLGYAVFGEHFSVYRVLGLCLGVVSIFLLARG